MSIQIYCCPYHRPNGQHDDDARRIAAQPSLHEVLRAPWTAAAHHIYEAHHQYCSIDSFILSTGDNDVLSAQADGNIVLDFNGNDHLNSTFNLTALIGGNGEDTLTTNVIVPLQSDAPGLACCQEADQRTLFFTGNLKLLDALIYLFQSPEKNETNTWVVGRSEAPVRRTVLGGAWEKDASFSSLFGFGPSTKEQVENSHFGLSTTATIEGAGYRMRPGNRPISTVYSTSAGKYSWADQWPPRYSATWY